MMWLMFGTEKHAEKRTCLTPLLDKEGLGVVQLSPRSGTENEVAVAALSVPHSIAGKPAPTATTIPERAA